MNNSNKLLKIVKIQLENLSRQFPNFNPLSKNNEIKLT